MTLAVDFDLAQLAFHHDAFGRLTLTLPDGSTLSDLEPFRCFPWSAPDVSIALLNGEGHEVLNIVSLDALSQSARDCVVRDLQSREFTPRVTRIAKSSGLWPPCTWQVETDRGPSTITIDSEDDVRKLGTHGALIADSTGVRFLIPDSRELDTASLRHLRRLL